MYFGLAHKVKSDKRFLSFTKVKKPSVPSVFLSFCFPTADSCFCVGTKGHKVKSDKRFLSFTKAKNLLFLLSFCPYVFLPQIVVSVWAQKDTRSKATKDFCHSQKQKTFCSFCLSVLMFSCRRMRFLCWYKRT